MLYRLEQGLEKYEAEHPAPVSAENAEILEKVRSSHSNHYGIDPSFAV